MSAIYADFPLQSKGIPSSMSTGGKERWSKNAKFLSTQFLDDSYFYKSSHDNKTPSHCVISLLIPLEEDVCEFLIFSYSFKGQQLLLK